MKLFSSLIAVAFLFSTALYPAEKYSDLRSFMFKIDTIFSKYVENMKQATSSEDAEKITLSAALELEKLKPEFQKIEKKYPHLNDYNEAAPSSDEETEVFKIFAEYQKRFESKGEELDKIKEKYEESEGFQAAFERLTSAFD